MSGILRSIGGLLAKLSWGAITIILLAFIYVAMVLIATPTAISWLVKGRKYAVGSVWKYEIYKNLGFESPGSVVIGEDRRIYIWDGRWRRIYRLSAQGKYQCDADIWMPVLRVGQVFDPAETPFEGEGTPEDPFEDEGYFEGALINVIPLPYFIEEKAKLVGLTKAPGGPVYALTDDLRLVSIDENGQAGKDVVYLRHGESAGLPTSIAMDDAGSIYVCYDGRIVRYGKSGELLSSVDVVKNGAGYPMEIAGIALSSGRVFVACKDTNEILVLNEELRRTMSWKAARGKMKPGIGLTGIAVDRAGNVYAVGNWDSFKIKKFTWNGKFLTPVDAVVDINTMIGSSKRIYVDSDDAVLCLSSDAIVRYIPVAGNR